MSKKKGVHTVEVILLFPVLMMLLICMIDGVIIYHNRIYAMSDMVSINLYLQEHLAQSTDAWLVDNNSDYEMGNIASTIKNQRGFIDGFHVMLDDVALSKRLTKALNKSPSNYAYKVEKLICHIKIKTLNPKYQISYTLKIQSPFAVISEPLLGRYKVVKGSVEVPVESVIQRMTTAVIIADRIEKIDEINMLLTQLRKVVLRW